MELHNKVTKMYMSLKESLTTLNATLLQKKAERVELENQHERNECPLGSKCPGGKPEGTYRCPSVEPVCEEINVLGMEIEKLEKQLATLGREIQEFEQKIVELTKFFGANMSGTPEDLEKQVETMLGAQPCRFLRELSGSMDDFIRIYRRTKAMTKEDFTDYERLISREFIEPEETHLASIVEFTHYLRYV